MYLLKCDRSKLADYIAKQKPLSDTEVQSTETIENIRLKDDEIILIWRHSPTLLFSLPHAVIVAEDELTNFLAWVLTYFRHIRPFTAHCRVLTPSLAQFAMQPNESYTQQALVAVGIGLILAEGISYSVGKTDLNRLPYYAFTRTLSFAYAKSMIKYERLLSEFGEKFDQIGSGWKSVRELSNQIPVGGLTSSDISSVWKYILKIFLEPGANSTETDIELLFVEALRGIQNIGRIPKEIWDQLSHNYPQIQPLNIEMTGPREGRVKAAESAIHILLSNGSIENRRIKSFIAGYLVSQIQPGYLDHVSVLFPVISELPESLLWYGACSGLYPDTSLSMYGNGVGLLMKRELERQSNWIERPNCDIALKEMEILFKHRDGIKPFFPTITNGILKVEIFPLVSTSVKWQINIEEQAIVKDVKSNQQIMMFEDENLRRQGVLEILGKIDETSKLLNGIRKQVENKFGEKPTKVRKKKK